MDTFQANFQDFLETFPLLSWHRLQLPDQERKLSVEPLHLHCAECGTKSPFRDARARGGLGQIPPPEIKDGGRYYLYYRCAGCQHQLAEFWIEVRSHPDSAVRKLGQYPSWKRDVSPELKKFLGADIDLYDKAQRCISQGYGVGACAYMRRLLEDEISKLLALVAESKTHTQGDHEHIGELIEAQSGKVFSDKAEIARRYAPPSLVVDGHNPFKILHDLFSKGVHVKDESECVQIAMKMASTLEFVVVELRRSNDARAFFKATLDQHTSGPNS